VNDARFILNVVGNLIIERAARKYFIPRSDNYAKQLREKEVGFKRYCNTGVRSDEELRVIAEQKAQAILEELPSSRAAVAVIDKETADLMLEKEKLDAQVIKLSKEFDEMDETVSLSEVPQTWTIAQFRRHITELTEKREAHIKKLKGIVERCQELDGQISKTLYKGLPGLREAVEKVVVAHFEKSTHLGTVCRRICEQIKFGDSKEALSILRSFEENEVAVSEDTRKEFVAALEKLGATKKAIKGTTKKGKSV
jgi:hypothetical protein